VATSLRLVEAERRARGAAYRLGRPELDQPGPLKQSPRQPRLLKERPPEEEEDEHAPPPTDHEKKEVKGTCGYLQQALRQAGRYRRVDRRQPRHARLPLLAIPERTHKRREADRRVLREELIERGAAQLVRVLARQLETHEIHDVHDPNLQLRQVLSRDRDRGHRLQRRHISATGHDHVRLAQLVAAGLGPDLDAFGAVGYSFFHRQPLRGRVLSGNHHVHIVTAAEAMVHHQEQAVGVWRQIDSNNLGFLIDHKIDKAWVLVCNLVVVLQQDMRREQIIKRGDRLALRQYRGQLQPLGVLVEHGIDNVDERFVTVEQAVLAGQQISLEPAFAIVCTDPSPSRDRRLQGTHRLVVYPLLIVVL